MKRSFFPITGIWILAYGFSFAIVDTNQNGLSDLWEEQFNNGALLNETFDPNADSDSDGWTNVQESAAGTNPFNPNPPDGLIRPEIVHVPAVFGEENGQPVIITPEAVTVTWPVITGKQYTLQLSVELSPESWINVGDPFIANGNTPTYGFPTAEAISCFWRVVTSDVDTEGDGLTDAEEHQIGSDPTLVDSDDDGLSDAYEIEIGTDPNDSDSDDDNLSDGDDADPKEILVDWEKTSEATYILIDIEGPPGEIARDLNDKGEVLFNTGIWSEGEYVSIPMPSTMYGSYPNGTETQEYEVDPEGYLAFSSSYQLVGWSHVTFTSGQASGGDGLDTAWASNLGQSTIHLADDIPFDAGVLSLYPLGIDDSGRAFSRNSYRVDDPPPSTEWHEKRRILVSALAGNSAPTFLAPSSGFHVDGLSWQFHADVSSSGYFVTNTSSDIEDSPNTTYRLAMWDNSLNELTLPASSEGWFYPVHVNDLPNSKPALAATKAGSGGDCVFLKNPSGQMEKCESLSGKKVRIFAGDGTAMTSDHQLWRNGKLIPMGNLCERFSDLVDDGWSLLPIKSNKHGVYLIQAVGPEGEQLAMRAIPVNLSITNSDSQYASGFISESKEESVGAFTVANLNDQDGDGVIDNVDTSVKKQGGIGEDEDDLMLLRIQGSFDGQMKVSVTSGQVRFWAHSTKDTEYPLQNGAIVFNGIDLPKDLYVEATAKSQTLRDIELELSHIEPNGTVHSGLDWIKATSVWAEKKSIRNTAASGLWTATHDPPFAKTFADVISHWGINFNPLPKDPNQSFHYSIGIEFELFPPGIATEPGVRFDGARDIAFREWSITKSPPSVKPEYVPGTDDVLDLADLADDDRPPDNDEDVVGTGDRVFVLDGPGQAVGLKLPGVDEIVSRNNFDEWIRVSFNGIRPTGNNNFGSRCSNKTKWHAQYHVEWDSVNLKYKQKSNTLNDVAELHIPLGAAPNP